MPDVAEMIRNDITQREGRAQRNRERMPGVAAMVDELTAAFGQGQIKVLWAREGDIEVGTKQAWT